jgi:hypothetical protein
MALKTLRSIKVIVEKVIVEKHPELFPTSTNQ